MKDYFKSAEDFYSEMAQGITEVSTDSNSLTYRENMPVAQEMSYITMLLTEVGKRIHAKTALDNGYYDDLIECCKDMGIEQNLKQKATGKVKLTGSAGAVLPADVLLSTRTGFIYKTLAETTLDENGIGYANIIASEEGSKYNCSIGVICDFPVKYAGILTVTNEEEIINGYDDETMQHLYGRYFEKVSTIITSGNVNYYKMIAKNITGVGDAKVYECRDENNEFKEGNVLIVITNINNRRADQTLIDNVSNALENNRFVGVKLNTISANELVINIDCNIVVENSSTAITELEEIINRSLGDYFKNLKLGTEYVSINKINSIIFNSSDDIEDVRTLKLNNNTDNIQIPANTIAVLGDIVINEV